MDNITLVIPAKKEKESLPKVLTELQDYNVKIKIILEPSDYETIHSIKDFDCEIIHQTSKGYGDALISGIKNIKTEYFCIFNADGSFDPKDLEKMIAQLEAGEDFIFASRYMKNSGSDDDTWVTLFGNFLFTFLGNFLYRLNISDILFTYICGKTDLVKNLGLSNKSFGICIEIPILVKFYNHKYSCIPSYERKRIAGKKKVNALRDGWIILMEYFNLIKFRKRK
jgi:glycosyltransferase involved in cell wall biosynthesis